MAVAGSKGTLSGAAQRTAVPPPSPPPWPARALTDEEDGEGDEKQEDVRHHVERVHEAAVVEDALVHPVGGRVILIAAEGQGHGGAGGRGLGCGLLHAPPRLCPSPLGCPAVRLPPATPRASPRPARPPAPLTPPRCTTCGAPGDDPGPDKAGPRGAPVPVVAARTPRCVRGPFVSAPLRACAGKEKEGRLGGWARSSLGGKVAGAEERRDIRQESGVGALRVLSMSSLPGV